MKLALQIAAGVLIAFGAMAIFNAAVGQLEKRRQEESFSGTREILKANGH